MDFIRAMVMLLAFVSLGAALPNANESSGIITSPGYPGSIPSNAVQHTLIELPNPDGKVLLHFEMLNLRDAGSSTATHLYIYDGDSSSATRIADFTGSTAARDIQTTASAMYIRLSGSTSLPIAGSGYYATYSTVTQEHELGEESSGSFSSPEYPNNYPDSEQIQWTITQTEYPFVRIEIHDFETEECCDYLQVRNGNNLNSPVIGKISGTFNGTEEALTYITSGNSTFIRFVSNGFASGRGFNATYHPGFRYQIGGLSGEVGSFNFPENYTNYLAEQWIITLPEVTTSVLLEFKSFALESGDVVTVRDGGLETSPVVGSYTGNDIPPIYISSGNKLFISFVTHGGNTNQGFFATYLAVNPDDYTTTTVAPICTEPGIYRIPFPGYCERFYQCVNYHAYEESCAPGMYFDPTISECNLAEVVDCPWHTTIPTTEAPLCPPEGIVYIPVPGDCAAYTMCAEGTPVDLKCPNGTLFDPVDLTCKPADEVECEIICPEDGVVNIPKPGSCAEYILCAEGEPIPQRCPDGTLFDPVELRCKAADEVICEW